MITPETAAKLKDLGFPLVRVGEEGHPFESDKCRFCGFPFLKIGTAYFLMPVVNVVIGALGESFDVLAYQGEGAEAATRWRARSTAADRFAEGKLITGFAEDADEALCLLWIKLKEAKEL